MKNNKKMITFEMVKDLEIEGLSLSNGYEDLLEGVILVSAFHKIENRKCTDEELDELQYSDKFYEVVYEMIH